MQFNFWVHQLTKFLQGNSFYQASIAEAMVQIPINNMMKIIQILAWSLLSGVVTGKPCIFCLPRQTEEHHVRGNLKLFYDDSTTFTVHYDSLILDCTRTNLPAKIITRVEATSANFILYSRISWRGWAKHVSWGDYSASEIGFPNLKVRSIRQPGCSSP